jgi:hypothetical protein
VIAVVDAQGDFAQDCRLSSTAAGSLLSTDAAKRRPDEATQSAPVPIPVKNPRRQSATRSVCLSHRTFLS